MTHLRRWSLLWAAAATGLLLVASAAWVRQGIVDHFDELAGVHGSYVVSHATTSTDLREQLRQLAPYGARSISRFDTNGAWRQTVGDALDSQGRAPDGPYRIGAGRFRVEHTTVESVLVIEFHPHLAVDLRSRADMGLALSLLAAALLAALVALWTRYRLKLEAVSLEAERTRHLAHLGTLSAVIAHELRNPLTVLLGHVQLLREDLPDNRSVRHLESGATRLDALLDSLLSFARTGELTREPTDPRELLERAAAEVGLDATAVVGEATTWSLDPMRVQQVLVNLLSNAMAASPDGEVDATVRVDGADLVFEIRDHGDGIPAGMHEQVFEPFHTTRTQGTGLGLAVARSIVEKHHGTLTAHDAPGGGARFVVRIPG